VCLIIDTVVGEAYCLLFSTKNSSIFIT